MDLAPLVRAVEVLMSPLDWDDQHAWLSESVRRVREARGAGGGDLEELLWLPGDEPGWLSAALDPDAAAPAVPLPPAADAALLPVVSLRCALTAGLTTLHRLRAWRRTLGQAFDEVGTGMAVFAGDGRREVARNARLDALLGEEADRARLEELIARQARLAGASEECLRMDDGELELAGGSYRLAASRAAPGTLLPESAILVLVDRLSAALPTTQELRITFGLRGREPQVALLAAEGLSNAAIAERLRLSAHTVRHYLERVLERLGLHSRKALAVRFMTGAPERSRPDRRER